MNTTDSITKDYDQMLIVDKYERVLSYLYPIAQNIPNKHGVAKKMFIECLLNQVKLFVEAGKSNQVSRLYIADSGLSHLRFWLRFLESKQVRAITKHQVETSLVMLAEVGKILGSWIVKLKRRG
jgi:hypothetical protein